MTGSCTLEEYFNSRTSLLIDKIQSDNSFHRCPTADKPHSRNGSYMVRDDLSFAYWMNWATDEHGYWFADYDTAFSPAEKKRRSKMIAEARKEGETLRAKAQAEAAQEAAAIWNRATPANKNHPYLKAKHINACGLRQVDASGTPYAESMRGAVLVMPVYEDLHGQDRLCSLQYIFGQKFKDGTNKRSLKDGRIRGCYCLISADDEKTDSPLLVAEGFATAASLHEATGYPVLAAVSAGNLKAAGQVMRQRYPDRVLCFCADNDCSDHKGNPLPDEKNVGHVKAQEAARTCNGMVALCPDINGKRADFNDYACACGKDAVRAVIEKALTADNPVRYPFYVIAEGARAGLYKNEKKGETDIALRIGPPLRIIGRTCDEYSSNWGVLLEWHDPKGGLHKRPLPDELLQKVGHDWASLLAMDGYSIAPNMHKYFLELMSGIKTSCFIINTGKIGWYKKCFVLPDTCIGAEEGRIVLQSMADMRELYQCSGTLGEWRNMAELCAGNHKFTFALCVAFAGTLLSPASVEGGIFSFEGPSSCGKTTCLWLAATIWGGEKHVRTWRGTCNGIEAVAALHNDGLLILDEIGQASSKDLSNLSYLLSNGSGKARAKINGGARPQASWHLFTLSSGEVGLSDKLAEEGINSYAGQEVRFVGIPVDKNDVAELHGFSDAAALVAQLHQLVRKNYGHASRDFLKWLAAHYDEVQSSLPDALSETVKNLCPDGASEQVRRVAQRFAVVYMAGKLAQRAEVLPETLDVLAAIHTCFDAWLNNRGSLGALEDDKILEHMRHFIAQNGSSRFQSDTEKNGPACFNRVGFRHTEGNRTEYFILPECFKKDVMAGFNERRAARVLDAAGWLVRDRSDRLKVRKTLPDVGRVSCYHLRPPEPEEEDGSDG